MPNPLNYTVYIIQSIKHPEKTYIGFTLDLKKRLEYHNNGNSLYTSNYTPWEIKTYIVFTDKLLALSFEKYLKKGSGKAFLNKRLI